MNYTVTKLDGRHAANRDFKHMIQLTHCNGPAARMELFNSYRNRCWQSWGPSCERDTHTMLKSKGQPVNEHWAWHTMDFSILRIYLVDDQDLVWFQLMS